MKKTRQLTFLAGAGSVALLALVGCGGQADNTASTDTNSTNTSTNTASTSGNEANAAGNEANAAGNEAKGAGGAMSNAANNASSAMSNAANGGGATGAMANSATALTTTPVIKTALGANAALKGSNINVDTTATTVTLSGTVKNATQKKVAETIAKSKAGGLKVIDTGLKVTGGAAATMSKKTP